MDHDDLDDLTEEQLDYLARKGTREERRAVARHPGTSLKTLLDLAIAGLAEDVDQNPLLDLYTESDPENASYVLEKIARQTSRIERLEELSTSKFKDVREGVSCNKHTPAEVLSVLYRDEQEEVRLGVASNPNTLGSNLVALASDRELNIRWSVAENLNTPPDVLERLAKDAWQVRSGVAANTKTAPRVLVDLSEDRSLDVREAVAKNKNTPKETLAILAKDENESVIQNICKNESATPEMLLLIVESNSYGFGILASVAKHENAPPEALAALAKQDHWAIRLRVANNKNTSDKTLEILSKDLSDSVRKSSTEVLWKRTLERKKMKK